MISAWVALRFGIISPFVAWEATSTIFLKLGLSTAWIGYKINECFNSERRKWLISLVQINHSTAAAQKSLSKYGSTYLPGWISITWLSRVLCMALVTVVAALHTLTSSGSIDTKLLALHHLRYLFFKWYQQHSSDISNKTSAKMQCISCAGRLDGNGMWMNQKQAHGIGHAHTMAGIAKIYWYTYIAVPHIVWLAIFELCHTWLAKEGIYVGYFVSTVLLYGIIDGLDLHIIEETFLINSLGIISW